MISFKNLLNTLAILLILTIVHGIGGCKSPDDTVPVPPGVINPGTVDNSLGFAIGVTSEFGNYYVHDAADTIDFTQPCQILPTGTGGDLLRGCMIEAPEGDLFARGVSIVYNVPQNMCAYMLITPVSYYTYPAGTGPSTVIYFVDPTGKSGIDPGGPSATTSNVTAGGVLTSTSSYSTSAASPIINVSGTTLSCSYDHTPIQGPNCCEGTYTQMVYTFATPSPSVSPAYTLAVSKGLSWNGKVANCLSGPAMDTQEKDKDAFPEPTLIDLGAATQGVNNAYTVQPPWLKQFGYNIFVANYFTNIYNVNYTTILPPNAFMPPYNTGNDQANPSLYYEFDCLDSASNVKASHLVVVRSWSTMTEFAKRGFGNPELTGVEAYPFTNFPNDDHLSWNAFFGTGLVGSGGPLGAAGYPYGLE